jgi:two-component sensor histidine kinase
MQVNPLILPGLIASSITLLLAIRVYTENKNKMQNKIFTLLMVCFFILSLASFLINLLTEDTYILLIGRIFYFAGIYSPVFFLHFSLIFPNAALSKRSLYFLISQYFICFLLYVYLIYNSSVADIAKTKYGNHFYFNSQTFFIGFYISFMLLLTVVSTFYRYRTVKTIIEKQQINNIFYGGSIAIIVVIAHIVLLYFDVKTYYMIPLAVSIFSLFIAAAILKFKLFLYKPMEDLLLEKDKVALLSRDNLEKEVEARTSALISSNENLENKILELERTQLELKKTVQDKELLLKEVHHRVKNNLQIISSLIYLQNRKIDDKKLIDILNEVNTRIQSMSLVHERIYKSNQFKKINLKEYAQTIVNELISVYNIDTQDIKVTINIDKGIFLTMDTSILTGLILNELITNAMKHAFPNNSNGKIYIESESNEKEIVIIVKDNGFGLPKDIDIQHTKTLGLQLVNNLVRQLGGHLEIETGGHTIFKMYVPKEQTKGEA